MSCVVVQITDCHLFADRTKELRDVATWPRFLKLLADLRERVPQCDLLVLTGDTAHDELAATYREIAGPLQPWRTRLRILPGNHDNREALAEVFPDICRPTDQRLVFEYRSAPWTILGLDSHKPGELPGRLGTAQLNWLEQKLAEAAPNDQILIMLHHPPIPVASAWLDAIGLEDAPELRDLAQRYRQLRLVTCGHVHQPIAGSFGHATVLSTSASGPCFQARLPQLRIIPQHPCYRVIELHEDGEWTSQVVEVHGSAES